MKNIGFNTSITSSSSGSEVEQRLSDLQAKVDELSAASGSESAASPEIDSLTEVSDFLDGYDNTKKLKDVVAGTVDENGIVHY